MRRLTILGLAAIKAGESVDYLRRVVTLLQEVYESCDRLRLLRIFSNKPAQSDDETWYISNTMPAFEALVSLQLMGAYLAKRDRFEYLSALLTPLVHRAGANTTGEPKTLMAWWPIPGRKGEPARLSTRSGRTETCAERIGSDPVLKGLFGSPSQGIIALTQYEFILRFNSFVAGNRACLPGMDEYLKKCHAGTSFGFRDSMIPFERTPIFPIAISFLRAIERGKFNELTPYLFDPNFEGFLTKDPEVGQAALCKFLRAIDSDYFAWSMEVKHFLPIDDFWPPELSALLKKCSPE